MQRREFVHALGLGAAATLLAPRLAAQGETPPEQGPGGQASAEGDASLTPMKQDAARSVRRPAKPGAAASMSGEKRDDLEHQIRCQCGCTLDVYTCRTTDFACQVSPAMHRDVMSLVAGGYTAQEILDAFVATYGERALMAPTREGFNLAGYIVPFAALAGGAAVLVVALRRMQHRTATVAAARPEPLAGPAPGTDAERARLDAAIRSDA
ncbi:MAG: cytochrome biosis protein [Gemmatimonadetes bacterium]|jgi:cytochrome c-type biogenesis protein CcmH|nr:cytochrome biosis protein [Gemmatimonadota bacterium]